MKSSSRRLSSPAAPAVVALTLALTLAGCGSNDPAAAPEPTVATTAPAAEPTPEPTASEAPSTAPDPAPATVPAVLDFTGRTVAGASFAGSSLAGKPVVLWFWAPWCAVCRSQAPAVESLAATYGDDLAVIGIGSLDSGNAIAGFADDVPGPTHLSDPNGDLWKRFRISQQSSFVVLDADGKEVLRTGYNDDDDLTTTVKKLVG